MKSDRELLELAAKAAGLWDDGYRTFDHDLDGLVCARPPDEKCPFLSIWAPLTDDGDALRLAVKLNMRISSGVAEWPTGHGVESVWEPGDAAAATPPAILRAAATIGEPT